MRRNLIIAAVMLSGYVSLAPAQTTITVGLGGGYDHSTIQAAIDAATTGDTVIVQPGSYVENIHFRGKSIILRSTDPTSQGIVAATIIDGNRSGSVVRFTGTETSDSVLAGFTIQNGQASVGGIRGDGARVTIEDNVIADNVGVDGGGLRGCDGTIQRNTIHDNANGGLILCGGTIQYNTITSHSGDHLNSCNGTIQHNTITGSNQSGLENCQGTIQYNIISSNGRGGLLNCDGLIRGNTISHNSWPRMANAGGLNYCDGTIEGNVITRNSGSTGGGLNGCNGDIIRNTISHNEAYGSGGGLYGCAGAIRDNTISDNYARMGAGGLRGCSGTIEGNRIIGNESGYGYGGGLSLCGGTIARNEILDNSARQGGGLSNCRGVVRDNIIAGNFARDEGGALYYDGGSIPSPVTNCIVWDNEATEGGGLFALRASVQIVNCTFSANTATRGGAIYVSDWPSTVVNSIFYGNSGIAIFEGNSAGDVIPIASLFQNNSGGDFFDENATTYTGWAAINLNVDGAWHLVEGDPLFRDRAAGDFHLLPGSPAIDRGTSKSAPTTDFDGNPRPFDMPGAGADGTGSEFDIGAFELQPFPDLTGVLADVIPNPVIAGRAITFAGTIANVSAFASTQPVRIEFWAIGLQKHWEGQLCDAAETGPIATTETFDLANLSPRNAYTAIPAQPYAIEMRIDPAGDVAEWKEANNTSRWFQCWVLPDRPNLEVMDFDFARQVADPDGGTSITFSATIHNTGSQPTTETISVEFCVWPTLPIQPHQILLCDRIQLTGGLSAGTSTSLPLTPLPSLALTPGDYYVGIAVDSLDAIAEQWENDNLTWVARKKLYVGPRLSRAAAWRHYR